jgi:hypothetical protein
MADSDDKLVFLAALLNGDRDARKILGDLLEDEGDRQLAELARSKKKSPPKLIELALCVVPVRVGLAAVMDFYANALSFGNERDEFLRYLEQINRWAVSDSVDERSVNEVNLACKD